MKILMTGADGMLGTDLQVVLKDEEVRKTDYYNLDITDLDALMDYMDEFRPDVVINTAAMTDVDACESRKEFAYSLNAEGPKNIALACKKYDAALVHISTDYVFKGDKRRPLLENDEIGPESVYGETKLKGEENIQEILDKFYILRTAWLYGANGPNFIKKMLELSETHDVISVVDDQVGSPTFTVDLANAIYDIIKTDKYGIYHVTNAGSTSWYDFAKLIFEKTNTDVKVEAVTTEQFASPAKRPHYSVLSHEKWINAGFKELRNYKDALDEYLKL